MTLFIPRDLGINLNSQHVSIYKSIAIDNICIQVAVYIICPLLVLTVFGTVNYCKVVNPYIGLKLCWLQQQVNNVSMKVFDAHMFRVIDLHVAIFKQLFVPGVPDQQTSAKSPGD